MSKQLLLVENLDPIFSGKLFYLEDDQFTGEDGKPLYDENPLHTHPGAGAPST